MLFPWRRLFDKSNEEEDNNCQSNDLRRATPQVKIAQVPQVAPDHDSLALRRDRYIVKKLPSSPGFHTGGTELNSAVALQLKTKRPKTWYTSN